MTNPFPFYKQHDSMEFDRFLSFSSKILRKMEQEAPEHLFFMNILIFFVDKERIIFVKNGSNSQKMIENWG